jgi:hypothetical protein
MGRTTSQSINKEVDFLTKAVHLVVLTSQLTIFQQQHNTHPSLEQMEHSPWKDKNQCNLTN